MALYVRSMDVCVWASGPCGLLPAPDGLGSPFFSPGFTESKWLDRGQCQLLLACVTSSLLLGKALHVRPSGEATPTSSLSVNIFLYLPTTFSYDLIPHPKDISAPKCSFFLAGKTFPGRRTMRLGGREEEWEPGLALSVLAWQSQPGEETVSGVGRTSLCPSSAPGSGKPTEKSSAFPSGGWQPPQLPVGVAGRRVVGSRLQGQHSPTPALQSPGRESQA